MSDLSRNFSALVVSILLSACGGATSAEPEKDNGDADTLPAITEEPFATDRGMRDEQPDASPAISEPTTQSGAEIHFRNESYALRIHMCSISSSGGGHFNVWAITATEEGTPDGGPRLNVHGATGSSTMRFFTSGSAAEFDSTFSGDASFAFEGKTLIYDGPIAEGASETVQFEIRCR